MEVNSALFSEEESKKFYEDRYQKGYMEDWSLDKKRRVREVIDALNLPATGKALDFGCGNGVFTAIIKQQLPRWDVTGAEISQTAVANAAGRIPDCTFLMTDEIIKKNITYSFVFTHHVLEHVTDLDETLKIISGMVAPNGIVLHILPCGNKGSFEYNHCVLYKNGIDPVNGLFFYEEEGHLRRLTSGQLIGLETVSGFALIKNFFSNHFYGAFWFLINAGWEVIQQFTDISNIPDATAVKKVIRLRKKLENIYKHRRRVEMGWKELSNHFRVKLKFMFLSMPAAALLLLHSKIIMWYYRTQKNNEWKRRKTDPRGSEMYLAFEKVRSAEF
jgi:SAM-dependent methyltransferase